MDELERIAELEKKLKARKRKALAKEYEKLGREFYKKLHAKSISMAEDMLNDYAKEQTKYAKERKDYVKVLRNYVEKQKKYAEEQKSILKNEKVQKYFKE